MFAVQANNSRISRLMENTWKAIKQKQQQQQQKEQAKMQNKIKKVGTDEKRKREQKKNGSSFN